MRSIHIFLLEWKHFVRTPFKVVALLLFIVAAIYGLRNGYNLYEKQHAEIAKIQEQVKEDRQKYLDYYEAGEKGPTERPWIDITKPFWSMWYSQTHHYKAPSPAMVYSMGQAEQYGFYKRITFRASPYDADMTQEIANPERLQTGTLDFTFVLLFLLPLVLLIFLYNLKSMEAEQGFLPLVLVQSGSKHVWLLPRALFYITLLVLVVIGLLFYGASLTPLFESHSSVFGQMLLFSALYLLLWSTVFYLVLAQGKTVMGNTLKMAGCWLLLTFVIPGAVHQWVSLKKPANLMTDFIDATRDKKQELYDLPDSLYQAKLHQLYPAILNSPVAQDSTQRGAAYNRSSWALVNELMKTSIVPIETENNAKNELIRSSYFFSPVTFFQNQFNSISETSYADYQSYRDEIQRMVDLQINTMVMDTWNDVTVDKAKYIEYYEQQYTEQQLTP